MALYEVEYVIKRRGREYPAIHTINAKNAKEAVRLTIEYTREYHLPHPFRPTAKKMKQA